jgi:hypothetical protein
MYYPSACRSVGQPPNSIPTAHVSTVASIPHGIYVFHDFAEMLSGSSSRILCFSVATFCFVDTFLRGLKNVLSSAADLQVDLAVHQL